jgi:hypothetical protein
MHRTGRHRGSKMIQIWKSSPHFYYYELNGVKSQQILSNAHNIAPDHFKTVQNMIQHHYPNIQLAAISSTFPLRGASGANFISVIYGRIDSKFGTRMEFFGILRLFSL